MNQLVIFNDLSLPYESQTDADVAVPQFIRICLRANALGLSVILFGESVDTSWFRIELANGYYFQDWFNRNNRDEGRDMIRAFRSIQTRQPFFPSNGDVASFDVVLRGKDSMSMPPLRAAVWHEAPLVSFPVEAPWDSSPIVVLVQVLSEAGCIDSRTTNLINIYSLAILESVEPILRERQRASLATGRDVVENMTKMFPGLVLCGKAKEQLLSGAYPPVIFNQVKESFSVLSRFVQDWQTDLVRQYSHEALQSYGLNHEVSGESNSVMSNPDLRKFRDFWLPSGKKECFEKHIKFKSMQYRLHFYPDIRKKVFYIGYIGPHLPT